MAKTKKNKRGLSEAVTKKKSGVTKLNPFDVRTVRYICLKITRFGFGMFIPDPDLSILNLRSNKTATKGEGGKIGCLTFFGATNFTKLKIIFALNRQKTFESIDKELYLFYPEAPDPDPQHF
jgi:hypothetical protein